MVLVISHLFIKKQMKMPDTFTFFVIKYILTACCPHPFFKQDSISSTWLLQIFNVTVAHDILGHIVWHHTINGLKIQNGFLLLNYTSVVFLHYLLCHNSSEIVGLVRSPLCLCQFFNSFDNVKGVCCRILCHLKAI